MAFKGIVHLFTKYYLLLAVTECQAAIPTDFNDKKMNQPDKTIETVLARDGFNGSENVDHNKMLQIEFNEIQDTIKNDLRKSIIAAKTKAKQGPTTEDTPNIVKKLDENSKSLLKALLKIQNDSRPAQPKPQKHKLKSLFITTLRPKKMALVKGTKRVWSASIKGTGAQQTAAAKAASAERALKAVVEAKEPALPVGLTPDKPSLRQRVKTVVGPSLVTRDQRVPQLPNAEILDMAPAKGARVNLMRTKGRLCHRHVLLPEGPKYDREGRAYMNAHRAMVDRIGKPFEQTHTPHLMLPSCCNCCKKSVLGCE